jgi:flagellar motor switch protein FliG
MTAQLTVKGEPPPLDGGDEIAARVARMPRAAKAAIVVRMLLSEGADLPLEELPDDLQSLLTRKMGEMGLIDRDTLRAVVAEFAHELGCVGLSFPRGLAGALDMMGNRISETTAAQLRRQAGMADGRDPWAAIRAESVETLLPIAQSESVEVAAVMLSKLDTQKAATLISKLPGPLARRVAYAVSLTREVTPEAVARIGAALAARLDNRPVFAFARGPEQRMGDILNAVSSERRDEVLSALEDSDPVFATGVRKALFTFADIPARVDPRDLPRVVREIAQDDLATALAHGRATGQDEVGSFILSGLPRRMAEAIEEAVQDKGAVSRKAGEAACTAISGTIRQLQQDGEITPPPEPEDEDG